MTDKCRTDSTDYHDPAFNLLGIITEVTQKVRIETAIDNLGERFNFSNDEQRQELANCLFCFDDNLVKVVLGMIANEAAISPEFTQNFALSKAVNSAIRNYAMDAVENNTDHFGDL